MGKNTKSIIKSISDTEPLPEISTASFKGLFWCGGPLISKRN
jgi:hypothetical protein